MSEEKASAVCTSTTVHGQDVAQLKVSHGKHSATVEVTAPRNEQQTGKSIMQQQIYCSTTWFHWFIGDPSRRTCYLLVRSWQASVLVPQWTGDIRWQDGHPRR